MGAFMEDYLKKDRMWGTVTMYNAERGFGFIESKDDGKSYFVHASQIHGGMLKHMDKVEFSIGISKKTGKEQAEDVMVIEELVHKRKKGRR